MRYGLHRDAVLEVYLEWFECPQGKSGYSPRRLTADDILLPETQMRH